MNSSFAFPFFSDAHSYSIFVFIVFFSVVISHLECDARKACPFFIISEEKGNNNENCHFIQM